MADDTQQYKRDALYETLSEVRGRLAELRYIDHATEYLEGKQVDEWWDHQPFGSTVDVDVSFGETIPFTRTYHVRVPRWWQDNWWPGQIEDEISRQLGEYLHEAGTWASDNIAALTERIDPLAYPSSGRYEDAVITPLRDTRWTLEDDVSFDFGKLAYSIGHWEGEAAENFVTNFYFPFFDTVQSHQKLVEALAGGVATAKAIIDAAQHSLMNVIHKTSQLLYRQLELRSQDTVQDTSVALPIIGGGASILAAATRNRLWGVGLEAVAAITSLASAGVPADAAVDVMLFGSTAEQLFDRLSAAVGTIEENLSFQYERLEEEVGDVLTRVSNLRRGNYDGDRRLIPPLPDIVDGVDADTFRLPDVD